jgi:protein-tyrosine-phosphatase
MAAALAQHLLGKGAKVECAGTIAEDGDAAAREACQVMMEHGLELGPHRSRPLRKVKLGDFDLVVALTPVIAQTLRDHGADASTIKSLDIRDPLGRGLEAYRETAIVLERDLRRLFGLDRGETQPTDRPGR